jgi:hypothetical protein
VDLYVHCPYVFLALCLVYRRESLPVTLNSDLASKSRMSEIGFLEARPRTVEQAIRTRIS